MTYERTINQILTDYLEWLKTRDIDVNIGEIIEDKIMRAAFLEELIRKCYDDETGFWYFVTFVIGP